MWIVSLAKLVGMSEIALMGEDEWAAACMQARSYATSKLRALVDTLEPYVDGSMGVVSAPHAKLYLQAVKDMGLMYQVSAPPVLAVAKADESARVLEVGMARQRALEYLEVLESRSRRP